MSNLNNPDKLSEALNDYTCLVSRMFLNCLHKASFCKGQTNSCNIHIIEIQLLSPSSSSNFFTFVLNALAQLNEVFGYVLHIYNGSLHFYIGLKTQDACKTAMNILKQGILNTFPGSSFHELSPKEAYLLLKELFNQTCYTTLTSCIVIPNTVDTTHLPINQKFLDLMGSENLVAFFLATPTKCDQIMCLIRRLESLYTSLSSFSQTNYSRSCGSSKSSTQHHSSSKVQNNSNSRTCTNGSSTSFTNSDYKTYTPSTSIPLTSTRSLNISVACNQFESTGNGNNQSLAEGCSNGCSDTETRISIIGNTTTSNESCSFSCQDKRVQDHLNVITTLINRLIAASNQSIFCFGSYFLADAATSIRAANTYAGLAINPSINISPPFINTWNSCDPVFPCLLEELKNFNHPVFTSSPCAEPFSTSTLITASELCNSFYFPFSPS